MARAEPCKSQEPGIPVRSPVWAPKTQVFGPCSIAFPGTLAKSWTGSRLARNPVQVWYPGLELVFFMGCQCQRQQLTLAMPQHYHLV